MDLSVLCTPGDVHLIVAINKKAVIGNKGKIPWHCSADLQHFKNTTQGGVLIMGRKTYESIGKPLPNRETVVLTSDHGYELEGVDVVHSMDEAVMIARTYDAPIFIAGGEMVYKQGIEFADRLFITNIDDDSEGDTHFILPEPQSWCLVGEHRLSAKEGQPNGQVFVLEPTDVVKEKIQAMSVKTNN